MRCWIALGTMVVVACGGKPSAAPPPVAGRDAGGPVQPAPVDAAPAVDAAAVFAPRPATPDEVAAVQAFLDRWLAAQNQGDFAAYQALYADPLIGVRRTGRAVRRFDRAGWMADRKIMFRHPMVVTAAQVVVYAIGPERQVFFTQTWSQGRFKDVGTKNLVVVGTGADTRIRYEELLGSRIVDATPPLATAAGGDTWFGYDRAASLAAMRLAPVVDGAAVVAATTRALPAIDLQVARSVRDPAAGVYGGGEVVGAVAPDDPLAALVGQPVVVLDDRLAEQCRGTIGRLAVAVVDYLEDGPVDEAELATPLWQHQPHLIRATVDAPCAGAFVRGVDAPALAPVTDLDALPDRALGRVRLGLGADHVDVTPTAVIDDGTAGFALLNLDRPDACDAPELHERALYAATRAGGRWQTTEVARLDGNGDTLVVVDLDGDGALDAVVDGGVYRAGQFELWTPALFIAWPAGLGCDGYQPD